jgi:hypothetical protein
VSGEIVFSFRSEGVSARAVLLQTEAPKTCAAILDVLPLSGLAHHAIYSGSEVALILPTLLRLGPENARAEVEKGELGFAYMAQGSHYGVNADFSELMWFYDRDARPSMAEGPVPVSVFARFRDADAFFDICRRMRMEGAKELHVDRG